MSYLVLARKWRPMRFDDLVGQEHVARTLGNAIQSGRVAHAFLFTGVRGVGKTTSARILAKSLNCLGDPAAPAVKDPGPTATPCLKCAACLEIAAGTDIDVREIDGASYNGVDEVRKLQDSLPYRPTRDRYKIFIVDEVHMLSQSAWNAFLKTLEEPPPHVKFIFATTEVQKVPITILSRVQRFDFKLIPGQMIAERLKYVLAAENIPADDRAISIVAREAAGSMRDAMSLLDQVIAHDAENLNEQSVSRVLGVASRRVLHQIAQALVTGDAERCLVVVSELANQGYDVVHVARDLLALLRDLVIAKVCRDPSGLLDLADEEQRDVQSLSERAEADDLLRVHQGFSTAFDEVVRSPQPRAALEMLLVRLARRPALIPVDDLVGRLVMLEKRLGSATPRSAPAAPRSGPPRTDPSDAPARPRSREHASGSQTERGSPERDRSDEPPPAPARPSQPSPAPSPPRAEPTPAPVPEPRPAKAEPAPPPVTPATPSGSALDDWRIVLEAVRDQRPELAAFLDHALPLTVTAEELVLGFEPGSVMGAQITSLSPEAELARAATAHFGSKPKIVFRFEVRPSPELTTVAALETHAREERARQAYQKAKEHPRIADAMEILGARLKDLKLASD